MGFRDWFKRSDVETRADSSYTDALVEAITRRANLRPDIAPSATAALEACVGLVGRAFAGAEVSAPDHVREALTPSVMGLVGRSLMRQGELLMMIAIKRGRLQLLPADTTTIRGAADPDSWMYDLTLGGPSRTESRQHLPASGVLHFRYAVDPATPWRGIAPLTVAAIAGRLSSETMATLADEAAGTRGYLVNVPLAGDHPSLETLRDTLRTLKGGHALVEAGDWGNIGAGRARQTWDTTRLGAAPPQALIDQAKLATREVYAACGINPAFFEAEGETGSREAYRQTLFSVVSPLGRMVAHELSMKLDAEVSLDWTELRAADIASRARAFGSLVQGGMTPVDAGMNTGIVVSPGTEAPDPPTPTAQDAP